MLRLPDVPALTLVTAVAVTDAALWLGGLPFELYAKHLNETHASPLILAGILVVNALLIAAIAFSTAATAELVKRGLTLQRHGLWLRPVRVPVRSKRSAR